MEQQNTAMQTSGTETKVTKKSRRGFASMDKDRHKSVSSKGGKTPRSKFRSDQETAS
jgi:general stress protein YciG